MREMMVSPDYMKSEYEKMSYEELLEERDNLLSYICDFEENKLDESEYQINPSPEVIYQMNHEYLGQLAPLIAEKYRELRDE